MVITRGPPASPAMGPFVDEITLKLGERRGDAEYEPAGRLGGVEVAGRENQARPGHAFICKIEADATCRRYSTKTGWTGRPKSFEPRPCYRLGRGVWCRNSRPSLSPTQALLRPSDLWKRNRPCIRHFLV